MSKYRINGKPVAKNRPRFSKRGGYSIAYSDQKAEEKAYKNELMIQGGKGFYGAIFVSLHFYFKRPKSHYRTGKFKDKLKDSAPGLHETKPDIDNLIKWSCDCMNGICFPDDMRITSIYATKQYSESGVDEYTEIEIREELSQEPPPF